MASANLLNGYSFRLVARLGLAADVPRLQPGEVGWDYDMKVGRFGDDTTTPPRVMTDKSQGSFDYSSVTSIKFNNLTMVDNATIDGVDISRLNAASGIMVRAASNTYNFVSLVTGDNSLQISNPNGVAGNIDIRIHPSILALINGGYLKQIVSSSKFTGLGTASSPLDMKASSTTQVGATRFATQAEADDGVLANVAITPSNLLGLGTNSAVANWLRNLFTTTMNLSHDATLSGTGASGSPLSVVLATETQRGAAELATIAELNAGVAASHIITPATLKLLTKGSPMAVALAAALGIEVPIDIFNLKMTGPGVVGRTDASANQVVQVIPFSSRAKVLAASPATAKEIIDQDTMAAFFPLGAVRPEPKATNALPSAASVGIGGIIYDTTRKSIMASDGTAWRVPGAYEPMQGIWRRMSVLNTTSTNVLTLTLNPYSRVKVRFGGIPTGTLQANLGGVWTNILSSVKLAGITVWLACPNGQIYVMYDRTESDSYATSSGGHDTGHSSFIDNSNNNAMEILGPIVQTIANDWNGQIRGSASSFAATLEIYQPEASLV